MKQTAIVGGGLGGLTLAYFLNQLQIPVKVYEKNNTPDILAHRIFQQTHLENSEDVFYLSHPLLPHLCKQLGIGEKLALIEKEKSRVYMVKEQMIYKVPTNKSEFWRSSLIFFVHKIKLKFALKKKYSFWANMSVYDAARNIFGESFAEIFASAFTRLTLHNEAEDVEIASVFHEVYRQLPGGKGSLQEAWQQANDERKKMFAQFDTDEKQFQSGYYKLEGGWQTLTQALRESISKNPLNQDPLLDDTAKEFVQQENRVVIKSEKGKAQTFAGAALAVSPSEIGKLLKNFSPPHAQEFAEMKTASHTRVTCAWNKKEFHPAGYGICVPRKEKLSVHCETYLSNLCPERTPDDLFVTRTIISGDNRLMDDAQLVSICEDFRKKVHGLAIKPKWSLVEHKEEQPLYAPGHQQKLHKLSTELKKIAPIYFLGYNYSELNAANLIASSSAIAHEHATNQK